MLGSATSTNLTVNAHGVVRRSKVFSKESQLHGRLFIAHLWSVRQRLPFTYMGNMRSFYSSLQHFNLLKLILIKVFKTVWSHVFHKLLVFSWINLWKTWHPRYLKLFTGFTDVTGCEFGMHTWHWFKVVDTVIDKFKSFFNILISIFSDRLYIFTANWIFLCPPSVGRGLSSINCRSTMNCVLHDLDLVFVRDNFVCWTGRGGEKR